MGIDGPLSRIATTDAQQQLGNGDLVLIEINPNGLLTQGMIAKGNLVLATDTGEKVANLINVSGKYSGR